MDAQADSEHQIVDRQETLRDCPACPHTVENAEHVFFNCPRFEEERERLHRQLQEVARPEIIVQLMLADGKNWSAVASFAHSVIASLRAEEMARRRRPDDAA
ncbi:hypothetical protein TKK_0009466 [Trichogramma kaykai]